MAEALRTLVVVDAGLDKHEISNIVTSDVGIAVVGVVEGMDEAWRTLQDSSCHVLVVASLGYSERALALIDSAVKQDHGRPVLVLGQDAPGGFVRRVFEAGADDILMLPTTPDQVHFSINKLVARKNRVRQEAEGALGHLVCVLGPKGGAGKTLVSSNLSVALAQAGQSVAIVDLDLQFGDIGLCFGLAPDRTFYDLALAGGTLDAEKLDAYMMTHASGVRVLLAPTRPDQASTISVELIRDVYASLRSTFDFVIVDTPPGFTAEVIATIDAASDLIVVGMLDALSLKNTKLGLETLELMGCEPGMIRMVLNRAQSQVGITQSDVVAVLGRQPDILIPSDREIPRAVNEGTPITLAKPSSDTSAVFSRLASLYIDGPQLESDASLNGHEQAHGRRRLFGRKS